MFMERMQVNGKSNLNRLRNYMKVVIRIEKLKAIYARLKQSQIKHSFQKLIKFCT